MGSRYSITSRISEKLTGREEEVLELTLDEVFRIGSGRIEDINLDLDLELDGELDGGLELDLESELESEMKGSKGMHPPSRLTPEGDPTDEICFCKSVGS